MIVVFLDPLQAFNLTSHTVPPIKDLLTLVCIYAYLWNDNLSPIFKGAAVGLCLYVEPASWPMHLGFCLSSNHKDQIVSTSLGLSLLFILIVIGGNIQMQVTNIWNILTIKDHSENIGLFYYISIETFQDHLNFFLYAYLIYHIIIQISFSHLTHRLHHISSQTSPTPHKL